MRYITSDGTLPGLLRNGTKLAWYYDVGARLAEKDLPGLYKLRVTLEMKGRMLLSPLSTVYI